MKSGPPRAIGELLLGALPQLEDLTERLRAAFPAVQTLRFSLGAAAAEEAAAATPPAPRRPRLSEDDTRAIDAAAAAISDPALAAGARRLLARAWPPAPTRGKDR